MSDEKIDLAKIAAYERGIIRQINDLAILGQLSPMHQEMMKDARARGALVRLARAVRALRSLRADASVDELDAALAPFTDTAQGAVQPDSAESDKRGAQGAEQREGRCDGE